MKVGRKIGNTGKRKWDKTEEWKPLRPKISIDEVLAIADKEKKKTGRYPSYGKVVADAETANACITASHNRLDMRCDYGGSEMDKDMHGHI